MFAAGLIKVYGVSGERLRVARRKKMFNYHYVSLREAHWLK